MTFFSRLSAAGALGLCLSCLFIFNIHHGLLVAELTTCLLKSVFYFPFSLGCARTYTHTQLYLRFPASFAVMSSPVTKPSPVIHEWKLSMPLAGLAHKNTFNQSPADCSGDSWWSGKPLGVDSRGVVDCSVNVRGWVLPWTVKRELNQILILQASELWVYLLLLHGLYWYSCDHGDATGPNGWTHGLWKDT